MKHIGSEIIIDAPISNVWKVMMDFKNYSDWDPFIRSIRGRQEVGANLQTEMHTQKGKIFKFEPVVLKCAEYDEFRWRGKLGIKGIFDGEHYFAFEEIGPSQTRFIHGEFFSGILVGIMGGMLKDTEKSFILMNEALKLKCEA